MIDFNKLHFKPTSPKGFRPAPSSQVIEELESYYGHSLPDSYKKMLASYNGNYPLATYFDKMNTATNLPAQYEIAKFFFLDMNKEAPDNIWKMISIYAKFIGPNAIPIAEDSLGQIYYFKWQDNSSQIWFTEYLDQEAPENILVSQNFDHLMESLYEEE